MSFYYKVRKAINREKRKKDYYKFLESEEWNKFRRSLYKIFKYKCWFCKKTKTTLCVHHTRYTKKNTDKRIDNKIPYNNVRWFLVVCMSCHEKIHTIQKEYGIREYEATKKYRNTFYPKKRMWMTRKEAKRNFLQQPLLYN